MTQAQQMWKTRTLTRDEIKTQQNQEMFTKYSTAKLSREAIKQGVWTWATIPPTTWVIERENG